MKKSLHTDKHKALVEKLKIARESAGLDQAKVAKKLKVTQSFISKIESGQTKIDIFQLMEFARIYKKDINFFIN